MVGDIMYKDHDPKLNGHFDEFLKRFVKSVKGFDILSVVFYHFV